MNNIPVEVIKIIFSYANIKCCMCKETLNIFHFYRWNCKFYGHEKCIKNLEMLMMEKNYFNIW